MPILVTGRVSVSQQRLLVATVGMLLVCMLAVWYGTGSRPVPSRAVDLPESASTVAASAPPHGPPLAPLGQRGTWDLIFDEEFDGSRLNTDLWHTCFWWASKTCSIESNHEEQVYTSDSVLVEDGLLRLRAQQRPTVAWNGKTYPYTSGMVMTGGRKGEKQPGFSFTYGYAEARMLVPRGRGLWSAFWLLPVNYESRPEIDITEIIGLDTNVHNMHYHYLTPRGSRDDVGSSWTGPDLAGDWHTFAVDWQPDAIVWYVDGIERWRYTDRATISREASYPLLNLAVGGILPGPPDASTPFPSTLDVDYVRIWKRAPDRQTSAVEVETTAGLDCQMRPSMSIATTRMTGGRLQVDVSTTSNDANPSNALQSLSLVETDNAVVDVIGGATDLTAPATVAIIAGVQRVQLLVRRARPGPFMVRLTPTDRCGDWPTYVGEDS